MNDKINYSKLVKIMLVVLAVSVIAGCCTFKKDMTVIEDKKTTLSQTAQTVSEQSSSVATASETTSKTEKNSEKSTTSETSANTTKSTTKKNTNPDVKVVDGITYVKGIMIANKSYGLPEDYCPGEIVHEADAAYDEMKAAAAKEGVSLHIVSGFRDYETQEVIYNRYVAQDGKAAADRYSARPGHSEHQTGYSMDLNSLSTSFGQTTEGKWLANNCWKYGFIIRYPEGKENITGYMYEPWHVRYLGKDTAKAVYESGLTLEEYLGIDSVYSD